MYQCYVTSHTNNTGHWKEPENMDHFIYLMGHSLANADIHDDIHHGIQCSSTILFYLRTSVFIYQDPSTSTKLIIYRQQWSQPIWTFLMLRSIYSRHLEAMERYHHKSLMNQYQHSLPDQHSNSSNPLPWMGNIIVHVQYKIQNQAHISSMFKHSKRYPGGQR